MYWAHCPAPFSSGLEMSVTRQFQHIPLPPCLPAAIHNSIGQNISKSHQVDECCSWREQQLGTSYSCEGERQSLLLITKSKIIKVREDWLMTSGRLA